LTFKVEIIAGRAMKQQEKRTTSAPIAVKDQSGVNSEQWGHGEALKPAVRPLDKSNREVGHREKKRLQRKYVAPSDAL
jgi:hypothetical protein